VAARATETDTPTANLRQRLTSVVIANPLAATGLLGGGLFLAMRLPVGVFYGQLGVSAGEVGAGPDALVPESLMLVAGFLLLVLVIAVSGYLVQPALYTLTALRVLREAGAGAAARRVIIPVVTSLAVVWAVLLGLGSRLLGQSEAPAARLVSLPALVLFGLASALSVRVVVVRLRRRWPELVEASEDVEYHLHEFDRLRALFTFVTPALVMGSVALVLVLPVAAAIAAARVRSGGVAEGIVMPWQALPVNLGWTKEEHVSLTNDCAVLRLLGTGNGQIVLYDTKLDKLFRVPVADASVSVDRDCA
jgi:hypothetical protein